MQGCMQGRDTRPAHFTAGSPAKICIFALVLFPPGPTTAFERMTLCKARKPSRLLAAKVKVADGAARSITCKHDRGCAVKAPGSAARCALHMRGSMAHMQSSQPALRRRRANPLPPAAHLSGAACRLHRLPATCGRAPAGCAGSRGPAAWPRCPAAAPRCASCRHGRW